LLSVGIAAHAAWDTPIAVDGTTPVTAVGNYTSAALVNGNPAICHQGDGGTLTYVRAGDATGSTWGTPIVVDGSAASPMHTSLAVVNGCPAISYYDSTLGNLMYVRANDPSGATWGTPVALDSAGDVGARTSMAVVDGNPAISYLDKTNEDLKYIRASDASGSSWGAPMVLDGEGAERIGDADTSLAIVNGTPAIAYTGMFGPYNLKFIRANDTTGSSWGTPVLADTRYATDASLAFVDGKPAISYYYMLSSDLRYVRASDASGTTWETPLTLDAVNYGKEPSLTVVEGNPAVAYFADSPKELAYIRSEDARGDVWGTAEILDSDGVVGQNCSLVVLASGAPAISYFDGSNIDLKYIGPAGPPAGITVTPTSGLTTTEAGGTATFAVSANTAPSADVTIPLASSNTAEGTVPISVMLPAGSTTPVTVTVTGIDDAVFDGDIGFTVVTGDPTSSDGAYNALGAGDVADVSVTNQDDETAPGDVDIDGKIDVLDVRLCLQIALGAIEGTAAQRAAADYDGDGDVDLDDAIALAEYVIGIGGAAS